jgi:hypothetical protein
VASTAVTATSLITSALDSLGVYGVGEQSSAADLADGLRRLNAMLSSWAIQPLTIPVVAREEFIPTANVGTYTIGPSGDFDTIRPTRIQTANLLLNSATPPIEVPCGILTEQAYQALQNKDQTSTQWTQVYYDPTFTTGGLGTISLWPIPTTAANYLVLYFQQPLVEFANLTSTYQIPPGYEEALVYNLAVRLAGPHSMRVPDDIRQLAVQSRATIKRQNMPVAELGNDMASIGDTGRKYGYNIVTGNM